MLYFKCIIQVYKQYIDGLAQDCSNSSALALELLLCSAKPLIYSITLHSQISVFFISEQCIIIWTVIELSSNMACNEVIRITLNM